MRWILRIGNAVIDTCLAWFTPGWRRRGHEAAGLLSRYVHYYAPRIGEEKAKGMDETLHELREGLLYWRRAEVEKYVKKVQEEYGQEPGFRRPATVEFLESLFVITVVFLGIRTYFVQPFRIPTNSMWPSLNGIVVHPVDEVPGMAKRLWDAVTLGSSYVDEKAETEKQIVGIRDERYLLLFTRTILSFNDGSEVSIPAASGTVLQYLRETGKISNTPYGGRFVPYRAGETIMRARVDAGDMVLVNRMAYHFRKPRRGETFVFDTRGINTNLSSLKEQSQGTHYIKRLCGLPGDTLGISSPHLLVDGAPAREWQIERVSAGKPPYNPRGYVALSKYSVPMAYLTAGEEIKLSRADEKHPHLKEYFALGDNTENSLDSRYWGPVRQFNLLGPASWTLWPFTKHWGNID